MLIQILAQVSVSKFLFQGQMKRAMKKCLKLVRTFYEGREGKGDGETGLHGCAHLRGCFCVLCYECSCSLYAIFFDVNVTTENDCWDLWW